MNKTIILAATLAFSTVACAQKGNTKKTMEQSKEMTTTSGLKVQFQSQNGKEKPSAGDKVTVHYTGYLYENGQKGKKFDSSVDRGTPFSFQLGVGQVIPGWDEGIALLGKGDKATLIIPSELGYGPRGAGDAIPPNATLCFEVELIDFKATPKATPFNVDGKKAQKTASGLEYIVLESGNGAKAEAGKTVSVHYTGYLSENGNCGKKFDSSVERGEPIDFPLGQGYVIKGWDEGIGLMKVGDKMRLIIPSSLGYGSAGAGGVIPPNATLIFDVELINVK